MVPGCDTSVANKTYPACSVAAWFILPCQQCSVPGTGRMRLPASQSTPAAVVYVGALGCRAWLLGIGKVRPLQAVLRNKFGKEKREYLPLKKSLWLEQGMGHRLVLPETQWDVAEC